MKRLEIKIGDRTYLLKFGYGCFRHLAETWDVPGLTEIIGKFSELSNVDENNISFEQMQLFIDLAYSSVYANGDLEEISAFNGDDFGDEFLKDPKIITELMSHFIDSLPKPDSPDTDQGKKVAAKAKPELPN